jgi:hypothetical protein
MVFLSTKQPVVNTSQPAIKLADLSRLKLTDAIAPLSELGTSDLWRVVNVRDVFW